MIFTLLIPLIVAQNPECSSAYCSSCKTNPNVCDLCAQNYVLVDGKCKYFKEVVPYCAISAKDGCSACMSGYYLKDGKCQIPPNPLCASYKGGKCIVCVDGYYAKAGECFECVDHCYECSSMTQCFECLDGYGFNGDECVQSLDHCKAYSYGSSTRCRECYDGYGLNKKNQCEKCAIDGCYSCSLDYTKCDICYDTKHFDGKACVDFVPIEHCASYTDSLECSYCVDGYYLDEGKCKACKVELCDQCNSPYTCNKCQEGYYWNEKECTSCPVIPIGCVGCSGINKCSVCKEGYHLVGNYCYENVEHCAVYSYEQCKTCEEGYYLSKGKCLKGVEYCKRHSTDGKKCVECSKGYYLTEDFKCSKCDSKCSECEHKSTYCEFDSLDENKEDVHPIRMDHCTRASADGQRCMSCDDKTYLKDGKCVECGDEKCYGCTEDNKCSVCAKTQEDFFNGIVYLPNNNHC
ncbi:hypothetical protein ENUP19_0018G0040 [Entamoeba nuttalli]|uniref:CXXC-rich protein n=1 Tax=Entamoeba nuttalli TaxID=412467 RepID=A0ABQ0D8N0_9EUKA